MKITKTLVGVFLLTFFIGFAAVFLFVKNKSSLTTNEEKHVFLINETIGLEKTLPKDIIKPFVAEIFGLKDFSDDVVSKKHKIKLVDVAEHGSSYREDEVIAKTGENWLGLFASNDESYLKNTKVKVISETESEDKYASIKFKEKNPPLLLLKNGKNLKEGKITTLFQKTYSEDEDFFDDSNMMNRGFVREFQLGDRKYILQVKDALTKSGDTVLALVLETENTSQVVTYGWYFNGDYLGSLLWVGDLDNDGKLDFYMNFNDYEKGSFGSSLFLSSEAEKNKLVKEVAKFWTAGC